MAVDALELIHGIFADGFAPEAELTVSEWADAHRMLSQKASSEPGRWDTTRTPYLREVMDLLSVSAREQRVVLMKGAQLGGPLDLDTPIPTPDGWTTMGALGAGDVVFDENGAPVEVVGVSEVFTGRRCLRIGFSDHTAVVCDEAHLWTVDDDHPGHRGKRRGQSRTSRTTTAGDIEGTFLHRDRHRYAVPVAGPLQLEDEALPADPYTLGVWLGDGHHKVNTFTIHEDDAGAVTQEIERGGHTARVSSAPTSGCAVLVTIDYRGSVVGRPAFLDVVRLLGIFGNKRIPSLYLRGSASQRWALLRGLMDTDGSADASGARCEFSSVCPDLCRDVVELLRSLGLKPTVYVGQPGGGFGGTRNILRVSFTAYGDQPVFSLNRKQERLRPRTGRRDSETMRRRIVSVEEVPTRPVRCIEVASERRLFLAGEGFIATHNTECGNNWIGYVIHHAPAPMLMVQPTVDTARRTSKQRLAPMIEATPVLRDRVSPSRARDSGNTTFTKEFPGGLLMLTGSNSGAGLRSMPIRFLFLDEVDEYPGDVDDQGDPVALAEKRTSTFPRRKILLVSTPTVKGLSRIEREFNLSDQRRYLLACPECGHPDYLTWLGTDWFGATSGHHHWIEFTPGMPESARMVCSSCSARIPESKKTAMLAAGRWQAMNPGGRFPGFHLSALYSPIGWKSWGECVTEFTEAKHDAMKLKTWINTVLGETWEERGTSIEPAALMERLEKYEAEVPRGVAVLTAAVDVQADRIECAVKGWGAGEESWLIAFEQLYGDPGTPELWLKLDEFLLQRWTMANGREVKISRVVVDAQHQSEAVYRFCAPRVRRGVYAVRGGSIREAEVVGRPTLNNRYRVPLYTLGTSTAKDTIYSRLAIREPGPGFVHLPQWVDREYLEQLTAEKSVRRWYKGKGTLRDWVKTRDRNEALDLEVYNLAALYILGRAFVKGLKERAERLARADVPAMPEPDPDQGTMAAPPKNLTRRPSRKSWANRWKE